MTRCPYRLSVCKRIRARLSIFTARERDHVRGRSLALARAVADVPTFQSAVVVVLGGVQLGYSMCKIMLSKGGLTIYGRSERVRVYMSSNYT